jgi:hypothetical protein
MPLSIEMGCLDRQFINSDELTVKIAGRELGGRLGSRLGGRMEQVMNPAPRTL